MPLTMVIGPRMVVVVVIVMSFTIFLGIVFADPNMLQDVCVANLASKVKFNGFPFKEAFNETDFFYDGLAKPGLPNNTLGNMVRNGNVLKIPGLNTLGMSLDRGNFAPFGLSAPHTHPRATEMMFVLYGELYAGFITTANVLVAKTIKAGELFVFPKGLVHFQMNVQNTPAATIAALNSQLHGTSFVATTLFVAEPTVPNDVLAKAFQIDAKEVEIIKAKLAPNS